MSDVMTGSFQGVEAPGFLFATSELGLMVELMDDYVILSNRESGFALMARGVKAEKIRKYGFAFEGKKVLILGNR